MQYINHWPDISKLALPKTVARDLQQQLLEPFDSEVSAKVFWSETSSTIIILDPDDTIEDLKQDSAWNQIDFALTYPEYTVQLAMGYQLMMAIVNDSGAGIYLVIPPELSHIIPDDI